jgi:hypothetical protein
MKKILFVLLLASTSAFAQHDYYRHEHHGYWQRGGVNGWTWMAPTIIGGVIGYEIARSQQPVVVQPPTVLVSPPPPQPVQVCSPWTEIQNPDGTVTRTRTCNQ